MANVEKLMNNVEARMMKEVEQKEKKNRRIYHFKELTTPHIILYPLMILCWYCDKLADKIRSHYKWNEKRVQRIITEEIVRRGELEKDTIYYHWRTWGNWWYDKYHCRFKDRGFCRKFNAQITEYFVNKYQLNGYSKKVDTGEYEWYDFTFTKI